ncbi:major capsid protein [Salmonella phage 19]|nr:hypothetical protein SP41_18 [Salmonella phage 41]AKJ74509.1 major capsid protein [Salmonella phage 19]
MVFTKVTNGDFMANQNYRIFPNKVELFKFFGTYAPDLTLGFLPVFL